MALLDLAGKHHHAPAHALLGGQYRDELPVSWVAYLRSAAELADIACALRDRVGRDPNERYRLVGVGLSGFVAEKIYGSGHCFSA